MTTILRPQDNPDLLGHPYAEQHILAAIHHRRLAHAWLISGRFGIGKATLAYRCARYLLAGCEQSASIPSSLFVPAEHHIFQEVRSGVYPDLFTIERGLDPRSHRLRHDIPIDDVRRARDFFTYTAKQGWRIVLIDGVDYMNQYGQNALLKMVEEPPQHSLLLLISEKPHRVLPTLRSRCRSLILRPLDHDVVITLLSRYAPSLTDDEKQGLTLLAEGSIGRALRFAKAAGLVLFRQLMDVLETLPRFDWTAAHQFVDTYQLHDKDGETFTIIRDMILWWVARLACVEQEAKVRDASVLACEALIDRITTQHRGEEPWAVVWENIYQLLTRTTQASLDRQQVILDAFAMIQSAASRVPITERG